MMEISLDLQKKFDTRLRISRANDEDIDAVWKLIKKNALWLSVTKKLDHWKNYYTREIIAEKIKNNETYILNSKSAVIATITMSEKSVDYYTEHDKACFTHPSANALYITALAVDPEYHGLGIATMLLEQVEKIARERNIFSLRFDCRAEYAELVQFYVHKGYKQVGEFSEGLGENYLLMEKLLS